MKLKFKIPNKLLYDNKLLRIVENFKGDELGYLIYCDKWKKVVWCQHEEIQMSMDCLQEVFRLGRLLNIVRFKK